MGNNRYINPIISEIEIKSANNRRIYLNDIVDEEMATKVSYFINKIIEMDKLNSNSDKTVTFLINSCGGSIISGNSIIGNINRLKKLGYKTVAIVESCAYSMAYDILVNCEYRYCYDLSTFLLHQTSFGQGGELKEFEREVDFQKKLWEMSVDYYVANTNISRERVNEIYDRKENYFFTAKEALENGSIQQIL